jgi:3-phosphoshikimate 1-carboxyvinyltransferase
VSEGILFTLLIAEDESKGKECMSYEFTSEDKFETFLLVSKNRATISGKICPPGSKSITNRALIIAALTSGSSRLCNALRAEDTELMVAALQALGIKVHWQENDIEVQGCGGRLDAAAEVDLYVGNAGTVARFLLPLLCTLGVPAVLRASARMEQRPLRPLLHALAVQGAAIEAAEQGGFPLRYRGGRAGLRGGVVEIAANESSQFASGLLLSAPYARSEVGLRLSSTVVSERYLELTRSMMASWGVETYWRSERELWVLPGQSYGALRYEVEPDASSASYFFAAAAISGGSVLVEGLRKNSKQADVQLVELLERMGCTVREEPTGIRVQGGATLQAVQVDMNTLSDVALTLGVVALFAEGTTRISGVEHMRHKECDRIACFVREVRKTGARIIEYADGFEIQGGHPLQGASFCTYNDHRMAMSLALLGLRLEDVRIENPRCVEKTYPNFFEDLNALLVE